MQNDFENIDLEDVSDTGDEFALSLSRHLLDDEDEGSLEFVDQDTGEVIQKSKIQEPEPKQSKSLRVETESLPEIDAASFSKLSFNRDVSQLSIVFELTQKWTKHLADAAEKIEAAPAEMKSIIEGISRDLDIEARASFTTKYIPIVQKQLRSEHEEMLRDAQEEIDCGVQEALKRIKAQSEDQSVVLRLLIAQASKNEEGISLLLDLVKSSKAETNRLKAENDKKEKMLEALRRENAGLGTRIIRVFFKNFSRP